MTVSHAWPEGDGVLTERGTGTMMQCAAMLLATDGCLTLAPAPAATKVNDVSQNLIWRTGLSRQRASMGFAQFNVSRSAIGGDGRDQDG